MKLLKKIAYLFTFLLAQVACYGMTQSYSVATPIPYDIHIPPLVRHGEKYFIVILTEPGVKY